MGDIVMRIPRGLWRKVHAALGDQLISFRDRTHALSFRLADGRIIPLVVDDKGEVFGVVVGGQDGVVCKYDFDESQIIAWVGVRKVKTGLFPWQRRFEYFDH